MEAPKEPVECRTLWGQSRHFAAEELKFRPAAYGIATRDGQVLVARSRFTGRWELPGGAVRPWELMEQGLLREYEEETGVPAEVEAFVGWDETFVAFFQHPFHSLRFYYRVRPAEAPLRPQLDEVEEVRWVCVDELSAAAMADGHYDMVRRCLGAG